MAGNPIPQASRIVVGKRDHLLCARCSMKATDWHHRRKRSVADEHQHCACVGVMLCRTCHSWAHAEPREAAGRGYLMAQFEREPWKVPHLRRGGWWTTTCDGLLHPVAADRMTMWLTGRPRLIVPVEGL